MTFQTDENIAFVQDKLGLTTDNINILQEALTMAQSICEAVDEHEIKEALNIVNRASDGLGTPQNVPSLVASDESAIESPESVSENEDKKQNRCTVKKEETSKKETEEGGRR